MEIIAHTAWLAGRKENGLTQRFSDDVEYVTIVKCSQGEDILRGGTFGYLLERRYVDPQRHLSIAPISKRVQINGIWIDL
jgi:hypothetical protein